ncbi:GPR1/FUN34/YaaH-class plasma membrane protein [Colletotrichum zoysiae]|uniref:GPR1/FUN34/YaaH-class plasma membrane protein n=1 Tax=Colletotrichum zoysiae TaxID=1216348 RepID=A0AAD9H923_9PEZI|nr:GPR1/FUN34/YaaH-class plasma membrane protein [Colletotrichum zoysiae]
MDRKDEVEELRSLSYHREHRHPERRSDQPHPVPNGYKGPRTEDITPHASRDDAIGKMETAGSVSIFPELLGTLSLFPRNKVNGDLIKTFGNPTPIAFFGFVFSLTPLACDLMGWRGVGGSGASGVGSYFFLGGLLMLIGGLLEWVLGNNFSSVVFLTFSAFWFAFGATLDPSFVAVASYAPDGATSGAAGVTTQDFNASFGFFTLAMAMVCVVFLVCSLRTNVVFFVIFLTLVVTFCLITAAYWLLAIDYTGNAAYAAKLLKAAGGCAFATCMAGWWLIFAILMESLDFPLDIPVGDLSTVIRAKIGESRV